MLTVIDEAKAGDVLARVTVLLSRGQFEEGKKLFLDSSAQLPKHISLEGFGNLAFYERDLQNAVNHYEAAIALKPERVIDSPDTSAS